MTPRSVVVHGHFYQPPRESPWTGRVPREASAAPFHDWNHRIHDECYRAVVAARLHDDEGRIAGVLNTLEWMSWDAGPTLLSWLAREEPDTYRAFLEADARSVRRTGHGNALASPYHHVILPLSTRRDKVTEVRWGIADFRRRFGREPEGIWLPEAAVDTETLEVLADEGILFTVLGPDQVRPVPAGGLPARIALPGGRSMAVFVYDGGISHEVAFGALLGDAGRWEARMADPGDPRALVSLATDGETFGHHHRWGDLALAAVLDRLAERDDVRVESYASFLARTPPVETVELVEPSSWSCAHGVGRWKEECGCRLDPSQPTQQAWRGVLRDALDELAADLHRRFENEAGDLLEDPWEARNGYGEVLDGGGAAREAFIRERARRALSDEEVERVGTLLEMERDALRMYTSCGWFFDDLAGLEPLQVLRYAAHAMDLLGEEGAELEARMRRRLAKARSNDPEAGDGRRLWDTRVRGPWSVPAAQAPAEGVTPPRPHGPHGEAAARKELAVEGEAPVPARDPGRRLLDAVRALLRDPVEVRADRVERLADALEEAGGAVPFEAQTELGRALESGRIPAPVRRAARRLGFADEPRPNGIGTGPVHFVFGLHVHQPVGNFDEVFRSHSEEVYLRFLQRAADGGLLPLALHLSGPLLEWLDRHGHPLLDLVARLVDDGRAELLLSGFWEPILPALTREERLEQIGWMRDWLRERLGAEARGLWLTERVWEPGLVEDLADAGVEYVFLDDRHFLVAGHPRHELHRPWRTESGGRTLGVFPIDETLRYLVPFRSPERIGGYLRALGAAGHQLAVLADDGEKFGGWPGTAEWVWESGWLDGFLAEMEELREQGRVELVTPTRALEAVPPAGLAYLPSASYREMEGWSLPPDQAWAMERLEARLDEDDPARLRVRGGHWRNFLARYPESNRMHKKAHQLSALCRERGDPPEARQAIGRAQCNDAYWHGVFGGLYLRHLREAVWGNLVRAEALLRAGEELEWERADLYAEGTEEILVHSEAFSAVVRPDRGGAVSELSRFADGRNLADVLTRRRESYHRSDAAADVPAHADPDAGREPASHDGGTDAEGSPGDGDGHGPGTAGEAEPSVASIHEREGARGFEGLPTLDRDDRALLVDRVLPAELTPEAWARGEYHPLRSWAGTVMKAAVTADGEELLITLTDASAQGLEKTLRFSPDGTLEVRWRWDPADFPPDAWFAPELSLAVEPPLAADPEPEAWWRHPIETVSRSEAGAETTRQGISVTPLWRCRLGEARLTVRTGRAVQEG
jgi:alpha-amylase/alpha-mannosidase (GH57 family)